MSHVIDVRGRSDAPVLAETGSGGLVGSGSLADRPLASYLADAESPRFVLRNGSGVTVERADETESIEPASGYAAFALVTDVRVLFAVGGSGPVRPERAAAERRTPSTGTDGQQTAGRGGPPEAGGQSTDEGAGTAADDSGAGTAADDSGAAPGPMVPSGLLDPASEDRVRSVPLADVVDVRAVDDGLLNETFVVETGADGRYRFPCRGDVSPAREVADAAAGVWTRAERRLDEAATTVEDAAGRLEAGEHDAALAALDEAVERLDAAREAASDLEGAAAFVGRRADRIRDEAAGVERRAHVERGDEAREKGHDLWDDCRYEAAYDSFEAAIDRYEAALPVDAADPSYEDVEGRIRTVRSDCDRLAEAPRDWADDAWETAVGTDDPETAAEWWGVTIDRYETVLALDWGRETPRFAVDREAVRDHLAVAARRLVEAHCDRAERALDSGSASAGPEVAAAAVDRAGRALADAREVARERAPDATEEVDAVRAKLDECRAAMPSPDELPATDADGGRVTTRETPILRDRDRAGPAAAEFGGSDVDHDGQDDESAVVVDPDDPAASPGTPDATADAQTVVDPPADAQTVVDPPADGASDDDGSNQGGHDDATTETDATAIEDPTAVDPARFPSLVAAVFRARGWTATVFDAGTERQYDVLAETDGPVGVTVGVWTAHPASVEAVDAAEVERYAAFCERAGELDAAAVASAAPLSGTARERAADHDVKLLDPTDLAGEIARVDRISEMLPGDD